MTVFQTAVTLVSLVFAGIALGVSIYTYSKNKAIEAYDNLDGLYLEVLRLGMENPSFVDAKLTRDYQNKFSGDERLKYEQYAFIAWNICETIYDRKGDENIIKSWKPAIEVEDKLHRAWFDAPENHAKFKEEFRNWILENFPARQSRDEA